MSIAIRQHFVPRTFLRNFMNSERDNPIIWAKKRTNLENNFPVSIKNVCLQKHIYTLNFPNANQADMMRLEDFYSKYFESSYAEIYKILSDDSIEEVSQITKQHIIDTVISMYYRVAKWFNVTLAEQREIITEMLDVGIHLENPQLELPTGKVIDISGKTVAQILAEIESTIKLDYVIDQINALCTSPTRFGHYNISIFMAYGAHEFLTSDVPIVLNNDEERLVEVLDESCHIMLNISPKLCLTLVPAIEKSLLSINRRSMADATSMLYTLVNNDHQLRNCENLILGTESGLRFFDGCKEIRETEEAIKAIQTKAEEEIKGVKERYNHFLFRYTGNILD